MSRYTTHNTVCNGKMTVTLIKNCTYEQIYYLQHYVMMKLSLLSVIFSIICSVACSISAEKKIMSIKNAHMSRYTTCNGKNEYF